MGGLFLIPVSSVPPCLRGSKSAEVFLPRRHGDTENARSLFKLQRRSQLFRELRLYHLIRSSHHLFGFLLLYFRSIRHHHPFVTSHIRCWYKARTGGDFVEVFIRYFK